MIIKVDIKGLKGLEIPDNILGILILDVNNPKNFKNIFDKDEFNSLRKHAPHIGQQVLSKEFLLTEIKYRPRIKCL